MQFGLSNKVVENMQKVFETNPKVDKALVFGSRAKGNYREGSDIDIAIKGQGLNFDDVLGLLRKLDELELVYDIDLINYQAIKEPELKDHIDRVGVEFYCRWNETNLGRFINVISGYAFKSIDFLDAQTPNSLPVIKIKNVANGDVNLEGVHYHLYSDRLKKYIVGKHDTLISMTGNHPELETQVVGLVSKFKLDVNAFFNQRVAKLVSKNLKELSNDYLYYLLKNKDTHQYLASQSSGSANQANISKTDIENIPVSLPPVNEQAIIAFILSSLDDKIDLLQRQNKILEQLAVTLCRQWFVEEAEDSWEETTLETHTEAFRGLSYKGSGLTQVNLGLPMHNLNSVYEGGGYKYDGIKFYNDEYKERHLVNVGDIIVANTEQGHDYKLIGFPAIIPDYYGKKGVFSQHIYKLVLLRQSYLSKQFIYYLLMTSSVREQIIAATNGSTVNMLSIDGLQRPTFKLPPKEKVNEFTAIVKDYWTKENVNQSQIRTLTQTRDVLLPKLMSGEVRVLDLNASNN